MNIEFKMKKTKKSIKEIQNRVDKLVTESKKDEEEKIQWYIQ